MRCDFEFSFLIPGSSERERRQMSWLGKGTGGWPGMLRWEVGGRPFSRRLLAGSQMGL